MDITDEARAIARHWHHSSFHPEQQAQLAIEWLESVRQHFIDGATDIARRAGKDDAWLQAEIDSFNARLDGLWHRYLDATGSVASPLVTGPANFPVERIRKARKRLDTITDDISTLAERALRAVKRKAFPHGDTESGDAIRSSDPAAIAKLKDKLYRLEREHERGKQANRAWIEHGAAGLRAMDWPEGSIEFCMRTEQTFIGNGCDKKRARKLSVPYHVVNGSARIRGVRKRIEMLERRKAKAPREVIVGDVVVRENPDIMRVQIIFLEKPDAETRKLLKRNGFRWAPSQGAWQRHLNDNGIMAANRVIEQLRAKP